MVTLKKERLAAIFSAFQGKRIAVVGDMMLDRYVWGSVHRISPEAPVPVLEVEEESTRLGGAANVANNIASLGGIPVMVGVVGNDPGGKLLVDIVEQSGFSPAGIVVDESRPTTTKTRLIAHNQHVVRMDHEVKNDIAPGVEDQIIDALKKQLDGLDGIILEDYNKGVLTKRLIQSVCRMALDAKKPIAVDPKFNHFFEYRGVTIFKPNRKETEEALGWHMRSFEHAAAAGKELLEKTGARNILLTLGERGMMLYEGNGTVSHVPTTARRVADVSGAGDTVISTLTMALVSGASMREAATLANHAGGIVCGEVGIIPIDKDILFNHALEHQIPEGSTTWE